MSRSRSSFRPPVSVVMPFAGTVQAARTAVRSLAALELDADADERILADNCGLALGVRMETTARSAPVRVIDARGERSPAHARNAGAAAADTRSEWLLFLDADTIAPPDLLHRYFAEPIADDVGAVAGGIVAVPLEPSAGVVARYGAHKNFLDPAAHLAHPFMPRAAAANLLVRRAAFDAVGGFFEGLRAAEDTDFSWRLQRAGWTLAGCPAAIVQHQYRDSLRDLRRQWRGYAAGRAWLGRRYDGYAPQAGLLRAAGRLVDRAGTRASAATAAPPDDAASRASAPAAASPAGAARPTSASATALEGRAASPTPASGVAPADRADAPRPAAVPIAAGDRVLFAALDTILGVEELVGFVLSNRPAGAPTEHRSAGRVLVADRYPIEPADAPAGAALTGLVRIEAGARADRAAPPPPDVTIIYREDDGPLDRAQALIRLLARRPDRVVAAAAADQDAPSPQALAPAATRLLAEPTTTLSPLSADPFVQATTRRLERLTGRELPRTASWREMLTRRAQSSTRRAAADDPEPNPLQ